MRLVQLSFAEWGNIIHMFCTICFFSLISALSWSPNGSHIVTANAVNGVHCIAAIVNRDEWTADVSLVGHQLPIEVAVSKIHMYLLHMTLIKSCSRSIQSCFTCLTIPMTLLKTRPKVHPQFAHSAVKIAVFQSGSHDSLSHYAWLLISLTIAFTTFHGIFERLKFLKDAIWFSDLDVRSPDGQTLYACSQDGSVACLRLEEELSDVVPDSEVEYQLSKYGSKNKALLPEAPVQLELEDRNAVAKKEAASKRIANLMGEDRPATMTDGQQTAVNGLTGETSSVQLSSLQTVPENPAAASNPPPSTPADVALEQKVTIGKDGKKRITPVVIRSNAPALSMVTCHWCFTWLHERLMSRLKNKKGIFFFRSAHNGNCAAVKCNGIWLAREYSSCGYSCCCCWDQEETWVKDWNCRRKGNTEASYLDRFRRSTSIHFAQQSQIRHT